MAFIPEVFQNCEHPTRVVKDGVVHYYPCGHCSPCLNARASSLRSRVASEAQYHRFTYFLTLTYRNDCIPYYSWSTYYQRWCPGRLVVDSSSSPLSYPAVPKLGPDIIEDQMLDSSYNEYCWRPYIRNFRVTGPQDIGDWRNYFGVVSCRDVQLFLKRLRKNLSTLYNKEVRQLLRYRLLSLRLRYGVTESMSRYQIHRLLANNITYHNEKEKILSEISALPRWRANMLRYFVCAEYGPNTFRPHYHGLLFTNDSTVARLLPLAVAKSWTLSDSATRPLEPIESQAAIAYVSKYVTGNTRLPKILRTKLTRTFYLASRRPSLGTIAYDYEKVRSFYDRGSIIESLPRYDNFGAYVGELDVRISQSVLSRYFPKCQGYGSLPRRDKLRIYSRYFAPTERDEIITYSFYRSLNKYVKYEEQGHYQSVLNTDNCITDNNQDIIAAMACQRWCKHFHCMPSDYLDVLDWFYYKVDMSLLASQYTLAERYNNVCYDDSLLRELPDVLPNVSCDGPNAIDEYRWSARGDYMESVLGVDVSRFYPNGEDLDKSVVESYLEQSQPHYRRFLASVHDSLLNAEKTKRLNDK